MVVRDPLFEDAPGHVRQAPALLGGGRLDLKPQRLGHPQDDLLGKLSVVFHAPQSNRAAFQFNAPGPWRKPR
jgi:hypothetical protein